MGTGTDPGILTIVMKSFTFTFASAGARLVPDALLILALIAVIELTLLGIWWVWGTEHNVASVFTKALSIAFVAVLIQQWGRLTKLMVDGFIQLGLTAGGDAISITDFTDPGNVATYGFSVTGAIFDRLMNYTGLQAINNLPEIIIAAPIALFIVSAYFALAIWITMTLLDFYAHAAVTTILLPFAINPKVAFLAEKAIAVIVASGIRLLVLSFFTAATLPLLVAQQPGMNPSLRRLLAQALGAALVCALCWRADKSAQAMLHGSPRLSIADAIQFVQTSIHAASRIGRAGHAIREGATHVTSGIRRRLI